MLVGASLYGYKNYLFTWLSKWTKKNSVIKNLLIF